MEEFSLSLGLSWLFELKYLEYYLLFNFGVSKMCIMLVLCRAPVFMLFDFLLWPCSLATEAETLRLDLHLMPINTVLCVGGRLERPSLVNLRHACFPLAGLLVNLHIKQQKL